MLADKIYDWLKVALDYGVKELEFWEMTLAEIERAIDSKKRVTRIDKQNKAMFDYTLAILIGRNIARVHGSSSPIPTLEEAYPELFKKTPEEEAEYQKQKDDLSALRFKLFAQSHNEKYKGGELIS